MTDPVTLTVGTIVALAFILVNLWVYLLWQASATRRGG